jgi:F0F1-type ATP synthase membrane subunit c/vacuolar-type H+-ATPase subunit K
MITTLNFVSSAKLIGAGLATIGVAGSAVGIGFIFGCLILALGRSSAQKDQLFGLAMLGFALTEAIALFALMVAFVILFS